MVIDRQNSYLYLEESMNQNLHLVYSNPDDYIPKN